MVRKRKKRKQSAFTGVKHYLETVTTYLWPGSTSSKRTRTGRRRRKRTRQASADGALVRPSTSSIDDKF